MKAVAEVVAASKAVEAETLLPSEQMYHRKPFHNVLSGGSAISELPADLNAVEMQMSDLDSRANELPEGAASELVADVASFRSALMEAISRGDARRQPTRESKQDDTQALIDDEQSQQDLLHAARPPAPPRPLAPLYDGSAAAAAAEALFAVEEEYVRTRPRFSMAPVAQEEPPSGMAAVAMIEAAMAEAVVPYATAERRKSLPPMPIDDPAADGDEEEEEEEACRRRRRRRR